LGAVAQEAGGAPGRAKKPQPCAAQPVSLRRAVFGPAQAGSQNGVDQTQRLVGAAERRGSDRARGGRRPPILVDAVAR
jgi:hypothetical protein